MSRERYTRRTALEFIGATTAVAGLAGVATAQDDDTEDGDRDDAGDEAPGGEGVEEQLPIVLAGRTEYWYGIAPDEIEGEENPALNLEEGQEYQLVWINVDGAEHELIVESEDGEELAESESSETAGEAVSMTFEASGDAAEYYCRFHPDTMRGAVEFDGGFDLSIGSGEETENGDPDGENDTDENGDGIEY